MTSYAVKTWRKKTKERIVQSMGGKCVICGYNKLCYSAYDLHHLDPNTKEFSFGGLRANPIAWDRIVNELKKCILVCATCHREIEENFIRLSPSIQSSFDTAYESYNLKSSTTIKNHTIICRTCQNQINVSNTRQKYCSDVCYNLDNHNKITKIKSKQKPHK